MADGRHCFQILKQAQLRLYRDMMFGSTVGCRLSLDFYTLGLHARIVVMHRTNPCVSWAFLYYTVKINYLLVRLTWK